MGLALGALLPTPLVHTVHGPVDGHPGDLYERVVRMAPRAQLISLSLSQRKPRPQLPWVANVPNALDLSVYPYRRERGDYLLFVGRMSPDKGAHRAVAVALEAGLPLKIAGKCAEPAEREYFDALVRPHLDARPRVRRRGHARREGGAASSTRARRSSRSSGRSRSAS